MTYDRFAAILLAGGLSTRMKQFKPLLKLGKTTILDHIITTFQSLDIDVFVVTGYRRELIESGINAKGLVFINNSEYEQGMFSSVQAGARAIKPEHRAFFILPADIPLVTLSTIKKMMSLARENPTKIIIPTYKGTRGHPPLIPAAIASEIAGWRKVGTLKEVFSAHKKITMETPVDDRFVLFDIDTPEDYQQLVQYYLSNNENSASVK